MAAQRGTRSSKGSGSSKKKMVKTLIVGPFRIGFENLLTPEETDNGEKFNVTMLFPDKGSGRETPESMDSIDAIFEAFADVMEDYFGPEADWPSSKKDTLPDDKFYDAGKKDYAGFHKNWMVLKASSDDAPGVIGPDKQDIINKREIYRGRWARAQIAITTFDNASKGCTAYLNHVQLLDHDEAFSGRGNAEDAFDKYSMKDDGRKRGGRDDDEDDRGGRGRGRGRDDDDDREDGKRSRGRSREDDDEDRGSRRGKDRDEETRGERGRGRSRGEDADDQAEADRSNRGRGRDDERGSSRRSSRDDDDDTRGTGGRSRGGESESVRGRGRSDDRRDGGRDGEDDRASRSRSRDDDEERPSSRARGRGRDDEDDKRSSSRDGGRSKRDTRDDDWN